MPLFEIAVLEQAHVKPDDPMNVLKPERLVVAPTHTLAKDANAAALHFVMDHAAELKDVDRERMTVIVRPFA